MSLERSVTYVSGIDTRKRWWARGDLNPRPNGYEPPALTTELQARQSLIRYRNRTPSYIIYASNSIRDS
jgi:hypothetical protein